jgi:hypothetical protein
LREREREREHAPSNEYTEVNMCDVRARLNYIIIIIKESAHNNINGSGGGQAARLI